MPSIVILDFIMPWYHQRKLDPNT